jgi:hypothetical protein
MQVALSLTEHTASLSPMQAAYIGAVTDARPYRRWRQLRLGQLLVEEGGPSRLHAATGTPASHFTSISKGRRQIGDELATKLEDEFSKPRGWMDTDPSGDPVVPASPRPEQVLRWLSALISKAPRNNLDELAETMRLYTRSGGAERHHAALLDLFGSDAANEGSTPATATPADDQPPELTELGRARMEEEAARAAEAHVSTPKVRRR